MKSPKRRIYEWVSKRFMNDCSSYNDLDVRKSCRSKEQARATFEKLDIPHAKGLIFLNPLKAHRFAQKHGFPLVIKPNVSGFSRGSHFPINNYLELWRAIFLAKLWWPTTVVEQFLQGKNYRVLVVKGEVMSVLERFPPFVRGDGVKTINQLIDEENSVRKTMQLYPCISPLPKNLLTKRHLKKQGYSLDSVPENGEDATLFYRIALEPGGGCSNCG